MFDFAILTWCPVSKMQRAQPLAHDSGNTGTMQWQASCSKQGRIHDPNLILPVDPKAIIGERTNVTVTGVGADLQVRFGP